MSDIVERLRIEADDTRSEDRERLLREAADLIDRLRQDCRALKKEVDHFRLQRNIRGRM